jgi:hypothetical protein
MIDRIARNAMAEAARYYLAGLSTNFRFDDTLREIESADPAIKAIRAQLWLIDDDLREHRARDDWQLSARQREIVVRTILFLKSDIEYQWPAVPAWYRTLRPLIGLLTFGAAVRRFDQAYEFKDVDNVWPFRNTAEIQRSNQRAEIFGVRHITSKCSERAACINVFWV